MTKAQSFFVTLGLIAVLSLAVYSGALNAIDERGLAFLVSLQSANSLSFWHIVTWLGEPFFAVGSGVVAAILFYVFKHFADAKFVAIAVLGANVIETPFKFLLHRARPLPSFEGGMPNSFSFPSGHALFATALYIGLAMVLGRYCKTGSRVLLWALAIASVTLVFFSRLCLGVHFPSDVVGGVLSGLLCVLLANWMVKADGPSHMLSGKI